MKRRSENSKAPTCQCGCNQPTKKNRSGHYNSFILGHNSKLPDNAGEGTRWRSGQSGNPQGCKTGSRHRVTKCAENIFEEQSSAISERAVAMALDGHAGMIKMILERLVPVKKSVPIRLPDLPKVNSVSDVSKLTGYILQAVADGRLSPVDGETVSRAAQRHGQALQVGELEVRLAELEKSLLDTGQ